MVKKYEISRTVITRAKKLGFDEPVLPKLKKMLINSESFGAEGNNFDNRAFEDYRFTIYNGVVCDMFVTKKQKPFISLTTPKNCKDCNDTRKVDVFEDCIHCDSGVTYKDNGEYKADCEYCFGKGGINKTIPCQSCSERPRKFF